MKIQQRLYEDYLKKSRLEKYRELLSFARERGYRMIGVLDFYNQVKSSNGLGGADFC